MEIKSEEIKFEVHMWEIGIVSNYTKLITYRRIL